MPSLGGRLKKQDPRAQQAAQAAQAAQAVDALAGPPPSIQSATGRGSPGAPLSAVDASPSHSQSQLGAHTTAQAQPSLQKEPSVASSAFSHPSSVHPHAQQQHAAESPATSVTPSSAGELQFDGRLHGQQKGLYGEDDHELQLQQQPHGLGLSSDEGAAYEGQRRQHQHQHQHQHPFDHEGRAARYSTILPANSPLPPPGPGPGQAGAGPQGGQHHQNVSVDDLAHPSSATAQFSPNPGNGSGTGSERRSARKIIKGIFGGSSNRSQAQQAQAQAQAPPPQDLAQQQQQLAQQQHLHRQQQQQQQQQAQFYHDQQNPSLRSADQHPPPLNTGFGGSADPQHAHTHTHTPPGCEWQTQEAYSQQSSPLVEQPAQQDWPARHSSRIFSPEIRAALNTSIRQIPSNEDVSAYQQDLQSPPAPPQQQHLLHHQPYQGHSPSHSRQLPLQQLRQYPHTDQASQKRYDQNDVAPPAGSSPYQFAPPQGPYQRSVDGNSSVTHLDSDSLQRRLQHRHYDTETASQASGDTEVTDADLIRPPGAYPTSHSANLSAVSVNDIAPQSPSPALSGLIHPPPTSAPAAQPSNRRTQEVLEKSLRQGEPSLNANTPGYRGSIAMPLPLPMPTGPGQGGPTTPLIQGSRTPQFEALTAASGEQGRSSPGPNSQDPAETEKAFKDLLTKYKNVKRLYFDGKSQIDQLTGRIEQLQNAVANQRISQSRTALDDNEYMTRFNRLNGAINNLSFNIRKDWQSVPQWLDKYVSSEAMKTGKQEMTAVGRAVVSRWLVEELFNQCFHPGLEPLLSAQLKEIELSIRGNSYTAHTQEEFDALTTKIVNWRMATLDGLHGILDQTVTADNRNIMISKATTNLTACLYQYLASPPPPGVEGSTSMIVELAVGIAANLPLESRDVAITYPLPGHTVQPRLMEVEKTGLPLLEAQRGEDVDVDDDSDRDKNGKTRVEKSKTALPKDGNMVRFAGFVALEVRGKQVLIKAPVWTL